MPSEKPNILFFHVDNLGMGELGCYGGGILRGADTKRTDKFATEGVKLTHYVGRTTMHTNPFGLDDRTLPDPLRQPHDCTGRQRRRHSAMGENHRRNSIRGWIRFVVSREVAHRGRRRALADGSRL